MHVRSARRSLDRGATRLTEPGMELPLSPGGRLELADALLFFGRRAGGPDAPGPRPHVRPARVLLALSTLQALGGGLRRPTGRPALCLQARRLPARPGAEVRAAGADVARPRWAAARCACARDAAPDSSARP